MMQGNSIQKEEPSPVRLSKPIVPAIASINVLVMTNPIPEPSISVISAPKRENGLNSCACFSSAMPLPVSRMVILMIPG